MDLAKREQFWSSLVVLLEKDPIGPYSKWTTSGGHKRALKASTRISGATYRFLMREDQVGRSDIPAVELQIDSSEEAYNAQVLGFFLSQQPQFERQIWNRLVWDADRKPGIQRRRRCIRLYVDRHTISSDPRAWLDTQKAMIMEMQVLISAFKPLLNSLQSNV